MNSAVMLSPSRLLLRRPQLVYSRSLRPVTLYSRNTTNLPVAFSYSSCTQNSYARSFVVHNNKSIIPSPSPYVKQITQIIKIIGCTISAPFIVAFVVALINGLRYFYGLCTGDKITILMLQVGFLGRKQLLRQELDKVAQLKDSTHLDGVKFKEVVDALFQRYDSCRFAYLSATQCSDERKFGGIKAEYMRSIFKNPTSVFLAYCLFRFIIKSLVFIIHWPFKMAIKKLGGKLSFVWDLCVWINSYNMDALLSNPTKFKYENKCSRQLFTEVLKRELVRYERDEETLVNLDGMKYEEAVGETHGMVTNEYFVVTLLVLACGKYSIPPLEGNTEHLKTVFEKFYAIPKSKIETVEVLRSPQTGDDSVSEEELKRDFPLLKPVLVSGLEG